MGYDWIRLHAALNDLPAALLLMAVLFDVLGAINRRESLKAAGFCCLVAGVVGGGLAALAGMMAAKAAAHDEAAHAVMKTHQLVAWLTLASFGALTAWRLVRRDLGRKEQLIFTTAGVIGVAMLVYTGKLGGDMVFEHGVGVHQEEHHEMTGEHEHQH